MRKRLRYVSSLSLLLLLGASPGLAQVTVTGTVSDENGQSLPGVNVRVQGTTLGSATNLDGQYSVTVPSGPTTLEFRFVGYRTVTREVAQTSGNATVDVTMQPDILGVDEVVVTGSSGATERRQLGNALSTVSADQLGNSGTPDLTAALAGKVPGALVSQTSGSPAGGISVKLRGNSTINSGAEPRRRAPCWTRSTGNAASSCS